MQGIIAGGCVCVSWTQSCLGSHWGAECGNTLQPALRQLSPGLDGAWPDAPLSPYNDWLRLSSLVVCVRVWVCLSWLPRMWEDERELIEVRAESFSPTRGSSALCWLDESGFFKTETLFDTLFLSVCPSWVFSPCCFSFCLAFPHCNDAFSHSSAAANLSCTIFHVRDGEFLPQCPVRNLTEVNEGVSHWVDTSVPHCLRWLFFYSRLTVEVILRKHTVCLQYPYSFPQSAWIFSSNFKKFIKFSIETL